MTTGKLPAVRLPNLNGGDCVIQDGIVLDLPSSNKFSVSWPSDTRLTPTPPASERQNLNFSGADSETSDGESGNERRDSSDQKEDPSPVFVRSYTPETSRSSKIPRFSRAFSMPLPSQLGYLSHPHRPYHAAPQRTGLSTPNIPPDSSRLHELSVELADSVQMMLQTMLQVSPPQLLDPAKEQFSASALAVPASSMSAILTTMKNLNYISANMADLCSVPTTDGTEKSSQGESAPHSEFDIGEMLQSVGDSLSGAAAQAGVDLVVFHGDDIGLRHVSVKGNESGITYALSHLVRQVLATTRPGDSIELGLLIENNKLDDAENSPLEEDYPTSNPTGSGEPLKCVIRVSHKFYQDNSIRDEPKTSFLTQTRPHPVFSSLLLCRLLVQIDAVLTPNLPPPKQFAVGRTCDLTLKLERASFSVVNTPVIGSPEDSSSTEPNVEQLVMFAEGLRGIRVTLYASSKGSFAHHLTSYLTAWGMDVTHVSPDGDTDGQVEPPSPTSLVDTRESPMDSEGPPSDNEPLSFIFIDDDVEALKERLQILRNEQSHIHKRPSLALHHRPRSSPQIARTMGHTHSTTSSSPAATTVIMHFTDLSNYKVIKDVVQSVMTWHADSTIPLPEIMIIPKPAGPRRILTALHTAVTKPTVDSFFLPIATSPNSPGLYPNGSFFHSYHTNGGHTRMPKTHRPHGSRSNSDRSTKSAKDFVDHSSQPPLPSPLSMSDNVEYFSEAAAKLGASPSSGLVIQSPDGQPAGIFFHPRSKGQRKVSSTSMERDKGHLYVPPERGTFKSRLSSAGTNNTVSFSSLHTVATTPKPETWSNLSPSARAAARGPLSPRSGDHSPSPTLSRRSTPADPTRRVTPPMPSSGGTSAIRGATPRRPTQDNVNTPSSAMAAASKKVKAAAGDGNIVPPISVLIVDDNPINQTILSTFMKKKRIKYDLANNGQEAVQKWRTGGFHLILMDIQMPVMDGIQATKEIRRLEHSNATAGYPPLTPSLDDQRTSPARTPSDTSADTRSTSSPYRSSVIIVALTASSLQSDRVAALAAGCNDFLTKPVSLIWLNNKIIEWGSIKALQMWADLRPDAISSLSSGQAAQARSVADRLHVPKGRASPNRQITARRTPPPTAPGPSTAAPGASPISGLPPPSASPAFWNADRPSTAAPSAEALNELAKDLAQGGRRSSLKAPPTPVLESKVPMNFSHTTPTDEDDGRTVTAPPIERQSPPQ